MTKTIKIVADSKIPFLKGALDHLAEVHYHDPADITHEVVKDADALIIRTRTICNSKLLDNTSVKFIATATIGYDHIDTEYCAAKGISWINAPGCNSSSVMQYISSVLVSIARQRKQSLSKMTLGVVGVGNVGSKVVKTARLLGMNVLLNDPPRMEKESPSQFVKLEDIISQSDIITFHVPLNNTGIYKTCHMADENFFGKFNGSKTIINTSRGPVTGTDELKKAIKNGIVNFCVLDVWEKEPHIDLELLNLVNIATPHIAGYSADGKANGTSECVRKVSEYFNLGMDKNWYPAHVPPPAGKGCELTFDCKDKTNTEIVFEAIKTSYEVMEDDERLRRSPAEFEKQRGQYPVRREFPYYKINLTGGNPDLIKTLSELGFFCQRDIYGKIKHK